MRSLLALSSNKEKISEKPKSSSKPNKKEAVAVQIVSKDKLRLVRVASPKRKSLKLFKWRPKG